ncbi:integrating conjugative element protein [Paraburkholderia agricolaris]|jgi:integrating conjugative element protein (TIGR03765 family)|uniref:integrating conjugative element protein n=1 Tax=Paraburkholderia agricolaris TaxID=2152888 RepID=UPI0038B88BEC
MLRSQMRQRRRLGLIAIYAISLASGCPNAWPTEIQRTLTVIEDRGGASALPYYRALNLLPDASDTPPASAPSVIPHPATESDMLPVRSALLSPGDVTPRLIRAPGLRPVFVVGDDPLSLAWLQRRAGTLRDLNAIGLVVHVDTRTALDSMRRLVPGLQLSPTPADDLAQRLGLRHYPALITATGIEQ